MSAAARLAAAIAAGVVGPVAVLGVLGVAVAGGARWPLAAALVVAGAAVVATVAAVVLRGQLEARLSRPDERGRAAFRRAVERLGDVLESTDDRARLVAVVLDAALLLVPARSAVFWRASGRDLVAAACTPAGAAVDGSRLPAATGVAGRAGATTAVVTAPAGEDPGAGPTGSVRPVAPEPDCPAAVAVPVTVEGRLYGVLAVYDRVTGGPFSAEEVDVLAAFGRQVQAAITTTFLHEETRRLAITDGLTGVWNRRWFELEVARELERARRFGEPFTLLLLDIDDFKALNDTYGHQAGDAALVELAQRLMTSTREVDAVARYGGEEFAVLFPRTEIDDAVVVAERILDEVTGSPFPVPAGMHLPVTVSMGLATHPAHGTTVAELVGAADAALYRAKAGGKNRLQLAGGGAAVTTDPDPGGHDR